MSAKDQARMLIDQLMGSTNDGSTSRRSITYDDPRVCKPFLLGCCPNDILSATRVDLGECHKIHDLALRADYEKVAETQTDLGYEYIALDVLEEFVADCDKKKEISKRKLKDTQEELGEEAAKKMNIINELGEHIGTKLAKAEELGNTGEVEESMNLFKEVDELKAKKTELEFEFRNSMPASTYQQQKLRVCDVCSAYLGIHDNDRRLADHFGGKLHLGFIQLREKLDELREKVKELREKKIEKRNSRSDTSSTNNRDRRSERSSRERRSYRHSRSRSRSNSKTHKSKHSKNRSRSRSRDKHRSSHRSKKSSSRDRKRHKRSRSR